ncbi:hypothetical protein D3C73_1021520 [compost metagenome]
MKITVSIGLKTGRNASSVRTMLKAARIIKPKATRMTTPLASDAVISNRCSHSTELKPTNRKALAISVTHSGRTALNFNMISGYSLNEVPSINVKISFTATASILGSHPSIFCEKEAND